MSTVVTYFSASGVTRNKAQQLAKVAKADLYEIKPAVAYTSADLNWMDKKSRSTLESQDPSSRPALADKKPNLDKYDTVYIGFLSNNNTPHLVVHRPENHQHLYRGSQPDRQENLPVCHLRRQRHRQIH